MSGSRFDVDMEASEDAHEGASRAVSGVPSELRDQRFQDLFDSASVGIAIADLDGRFIDANPACLDMLGYTLEEFCQQDLTSVTHPDDRGSNREDLRALLAGEIRAFNVERRYRTKAGEVAWGHACVSVIRDDRGDPLHLGIMVKDVTDLHAAKVEAQQAVRNHAATLESITDAVLTVDRDWRIAFLNERAEHLLRRDQHEILEASLWEVFPEAVDTPLYEAFRGAIRYGRTVQIEEEYYPPLGIWLSLTASPSGHGLAIYFRDVTASRRARQELREREATLQRQAALLDEAQDAIMVCDLDGHITFWNRGAERIYGWSAEEAVGHDIRDLVYEDPSEYDRATTQVQELGAWSGQITQRTRADERVVVAGRWSLLRDDHGDPEAVLAINTDVTTWQKVEQQLLHAQRMESIGFLASGVAHDLNNILSPIMLACDLLRGVGDDQVSELADMIATSANRGTDLVEQVLSFARGMEGQRRPVDITSRLNDLATIVRDTFPKNIDLVLDTPDGVPGLVGDATQIQQVLLNLAVNARDAMPDGGTLTIRAFEVALDAQYVAATPEVFPGDYLVVEVEDTGTGMPPEVRDRIFEPFFTTKPQGAGTGLGLSTSQTIATSHGGFLQVYSELGRGSRFRLHLPLRPEDDVAGEEEAPPSVLPHGNGETVLIVDDEDRIRTMASRTLMAHGYQALAAVNGADAVSKFAQYRGIIDVVVVDMMMPVMDGPATIHALRSLDPDVRIIGASGLHGDGKVTQATKAGVRHFLPKPYTARSLLETLRAILIAQR
jgi:two-component system, cell cycle sensor histidine kinase and response regulator CckA